MRTLSLPEKYELTRTLHARAIKGKDLAPSIFVRGATMPLCSFGASVTKESLNCFRGGPVDHCARISGLPVSCHRSPCCFGSVSRRRFGWRRDTVETLLGDRSERLFRSSLSPSS